MTHYPDRIPHDSWINSQLSIAKYYGGIRMNGKDYLVEPGTNDLVHTPKPARKKAKK